MDKSLNMLGGIDIASASGLEFGPLMAPMVRKEQGAVSYIDHLDTEGLRKKYAADPNVDVMSIVEVDFVEDGRSLSAIVESTTFDYVIASHVVEHLPNPLGWLSECASVLKPGGRLALAVPDKRYTFDFFRPLTTTGEWVEASIAGRRRPSPRSVFEACTLTAGGTFGDLWQDEPIAPMVTDEQRTWAVAEAERALRDYIDVHCTVATPATFVALLRETASLGLHAFALEGIYDTAPGWIEFQLRLAHRPDLSLADRAASFDAAHDDDLPSADAGHDPDQEEADAPLVQPGS